MSTMLPPPVSRNRSATVLALIVACLLALTSLAGDAYAAQPPVGLGTANPFAVLAGSTVTNTGPSTINGNLGVSPGAAVTGFPPGTVNGTIDKANAVASQAQSDLTTAYNDAAGRTPALAVSADLGGQTLTPGVYKSASSLGLTGTLTLDAQGDPDAVFIFQAGSTLTTAGGVNLINGAQSCNVFWQVGSSATLGTPPSPSSVFRGTILALTSITLVTGVTVDGRALARNGAVTLDTNTITPAPCTTGGGTGGGGTTTTPGGGGTTTRPAGGGGTTTTSGGGGTGSTPGGGGTTTTPGGGGTGSTPGGGGTGSTPGGGGTGSTPGGGGTGSTPGGGGTGSTPGGGGTDESRATTGGGDSTQGGTNAGPSTSTSTNNLPFTGLDVLWLVLGGAILSVAGMALRRGALRRQGE